MAIGQQLKRWPQIQVGSRLKICSVCCARKTACQFARVQHAAAQAAVVVAGIAESEGACFRGRVALAGVVDRKPSAFGMLFHHDGVASGTFSAAEKRGSALAHTASQRRLFPDKYYISSSACRRSPANRAAVYQVKSPVSPLQVNAVFVVKPSLLTRREARYQHIHRASHS